jgi:hypothetical protein
MLTSAVVDFPAPKSDGVFWAFCLRFPLSSTHSLSDTQTQQSTTRFQDTGELIDQKVEYNYLHCLAF